MINWLKKTLLSNNNTENIELVDNSESQTALPKNTTEDLLAKGYAHLDNSNWIAAEKYFRQVIAIEPRHFPAQFNLGYALFELNHFEDAVAYISDSISIRSNDSPEKIESLAEAHYFLAQSFLALNRIDEAIESFELAVTLVPNRAIYHYTLGFVYTQQLLLDDAIACYRKAIVLEPNLKDAYSNLLLNLQYQNGLSQTNLFEEHLKFAKLIEANVKNNKPTYQNQITPNKILKIGYLSADFNRHSVALFMVPILANHDEAQVETFCYYNNTTQDAVTENIKFLADHFIECAEMSDEELFSHIQHDKIDILVDLSGHTAGNRLLVLANKPAPIQVTYLGYVDTTGLSSIDYRITNLDADPVENDAYYSEKLYRLENQLWWCYRPAPNLPEITKLPALKNGFITFISTNNIIKISSEMIQLWAEILSKVPKARLVIMGVSTGTLQQKIASQLTKLGINEDRITMHSRVNLDEYRQILLKTDISLDTYPYNGGTTSCETLQLGLPIITLMGKSFVSRMGYALLKSIGLEQFAAKNKQEYVNIAISLASNLNHLAELRSGMKQRLASSSLCDELGFTQSLERAYRDMWQKYTTNTTER